MKLVTPKYDALNRIVETGEVTDTEDVFATLSESNGAQQIDGETFAILLSTGIKTEVTQTYYDEPLVLNTPPAVTLAQENLRNRVAAVTFTEDPSNPLSPTEPYDNAVHYSYDIHGNVNRMYTEMGEWGGMGDDMRFKNLEYEYDLLSGNVKQVSYQKDKKDQFIHRYTYDGENRIKTVMTSANGQIWDLDAKYFYYDHGPLARVELGENQVQGLDYVYTLQGWLKGINSNTLDPNRDPAHDGLNVIDNVNASFARDVYGLTLGYFSGDYKPIDQAGHWNTVADRFEADLTGSNLQTHRHNLYNGNIGAMVSTITDPSDMSPMPIGNAYEYDQLQRLTHARSFTDLNTTTNTWASGQAYDGKYENSFVYDANGNIESQLRKDASGVAIDDLTYRYQDGTYGRSRNRLYHVNDAVNASAFDDDIDDQGTFTAVPSDINSLNNYRYDELGQLTHDAQEEIENITWRNDGKIKSITRVGNSPEKDLTFTYDPMGNRLSKKVFDPSGDILTADYYIRDAQGNVMAVYKLNIDPQTQTTIWTVVERNIYGSDRLGVYAYPDTVYPAQGAPTTDYTSVWRGYRKYELKNHLGNVVTVVSGHKIPVQDGSSIGHFTTQIDAAYDYSPFGVTRMEFGEYRYGFQGQEKDDEIKGSGNSINYKYRMHNPRLGRFFAVDPLAGKYPYYSPYQFSGNRVIDMIELEGLEPTQPLYMWQASGVNEYNHGTMMKVEGWWVFLSVNNEAEDVHQYWDPNNEVWKEFTPAQPSCLSCDLQDLAELGLEKTVEYGVPTLKIAAGIIAVAAAVPSGGTSLTALGALGVGFGVTAGSYTAASGLAELTLNVANKQELTEKIPSGYLNATVGITMTSLIDDKEVTERITGTLTIIEGVATYNFKDPTALQKIDNAINISNVTLSNVQREKQEESEEPSKN